MKTLTAILVMMVAFPCWAGPQEKKPAGPVDLIGKATLGDAKAPKGWKLIGKGALGVTAELPDREVISFDYVAPAEYDLSLTVERLSADKDSFDVGIVAGNNACTFSFDVEGATKSWLSAMALRVYDFPNVAPGGVFSKGKPHTFKLMVRKNTLEVLMDGKKFYKTKPLDWTEATVHEKIKVTDKTKPFLCVGNGAWKVTAFTIEPIQAK